MVKDSPVFIYILIGILFVAIGWTNYQFANQVHSIDTKGTEQLQRDRIIVDSNKSRIQSLEDRNVNITSRLRNLEKKVLNKGINGK